MEPYVNYCAENARQRNQMREKARLANRSFSILTWRTCRLLGPILSSLFILLVGTLISGCQATSAGSPTPTTLSSTPTAVSAPAISSTPTARAAHGVPSPDHIVVVMEENHSYSQIIGASDAPYINSLAHSGALFTNSTAITHPSEPNYLALFSGSTQNVPDDSCPHTFSGPDLGGALLSAGKTFVGYSENLPSVGYTGCSFGGSYARKHNPWVNFSDVPSSDNQPLTSFPTDFTTLPTVSFVIPNLLDDMHDGSVKEGDDWLKAHLDGYVQWAKTHNSLLIVTADEDYGSLNNQIATIFVGQMVKVGQYNEAINHYSVLRTLQDAYGLPYAHNSANSSPITNCWQ